VDLQQAVSDYVPHAPVLACEVLSDLTRYLCALGRAEEARREVEAFTERYPRGSFRDYEFFDHRYNRSICVAVTKREQANPAAHRAITSTRCGAKHLTRRNTISARLLPGCSDAITHKCSRAAGCSSRACDVLSRVRSPLRDTGP
jgi:hypothetical protein